MNNATLGIDGSNLRGGGGVTHIVQLLCHLEPQKYGFSKIILWGDQKLCELAPQRPWLLCINPPILNHSLPLRLIWQQFVLPLTAHNYGCDLLFSPGGTAPLCLRNPYVVMQQNLLIFATREQKRYRYGLMRLRLVFLRLMQKRSIKNARGIIYLSEFAKNLIKKETSQSQGIDTIIRHGIEQRFFAKTDLPKTPESFCQENPFKLIYVSIIDVYKHQSEVAEAVKLLQSQGLAVKIDFIGPAYAPALRQFQATLNRLDPEEKFMSYLGPLPFAKLHLVYQKTDAVVFASSCENLPIILLEGMASGKAIASSNRGPMPEILGDAGLYFDPEKPASIAEAIKKLYYGQKLRPQLSALSLKKARDYNWGKCAGETMEFLRKCLPNIPEEQGENPCAG